MSNTAELIGGVLFDSKNPYDDATALADIISGRRTDSGEFHPDLLKVVRRHVIEGGLDPHVACELGAAWVMGRRSAIAPAEWELVASVPASATRPPGISRTTAETLIGLMGRATSSIRLASPFVNESGLALLVDSLVAATHRGVSVDLLLSDRPSADESDYGGLLSALEKSGNPQLVTVHVMREDGPWSHMKVVSVDSKWCYIGSANLTGAGLAYRNLELGVLVSGSGVEAVDAVLELFKGRRNAH